MRLSDCKEGTYRVVRLPQGDCGDRFLIMGIQVGSPIKVILNSFISPIVIEHKHSTLSIGRGMAEKVFVEE